MAYSDRFISADNLITHINPVVSIITDNSIKANYAGFISVSAVTVYELAIKDIFLEFAAKKNAVFGCFVESHFSSINGRIKLKDLRDQSISLFGEKYLKNFEKKLSVRENAIFNTQRKNVRSDYTNLIICRHKYVHGGTPTLTFREVLDSYEIGKEVIHALYEAMKR